MPFDPFLFIKNAETRSPKLARTLAMVFLSLMAPFNRHLGARLDEWTDNHSVIFLKKRRKICNHVKNIHAGALFTLGETCAGLVIIRNFPFRDYRPLMSGVKASYIKQARTAVTGECRADPAALENARKIFAAGEVPVIEMVTTILNPQRETVAVVTTTWQIKPWTQVRK